MVTQNKSTQAAMTPELARQTLEQGNARFVKREKAERDLLQQVEDTRGGQWPFAVVLSCIDSRVPAELVFDQGLGDMFNIRVAGNFVNEDVLGSMEFSCKVAGAKLIVVLGHKSCGAIKGACDDVQLGNLTKLLSKLKPAVSATKEPQDPGQRNSGNAAFVQSVARKNVHLTMDEIQSKSDVLKDMLAAGEVALVGAMYDVESGAVEFMD